jgi:hypothetical protein
MTKTRFLINKGGVFYLTTGKLLTYDSGAAKDEQQKKGVKYVEEAFERIKNQPHTWYQAVEISDANFSAVQTGEAA